MNTENIKLIVCDLDNTLLPAGQTHISERLTKDLFELEKRGYRFLLDTGRHYTFLQQNLFDELPLHEIGTINGACLVNRDGSVIEQHPMTLEHMWAITKLAEENDIGLGFKFIDAVVSYANHEKFLEGYCANDEFRRSRVIDDAANRTHHERYGAPLGTFIIGDETVIEKYTNSIPELVFAWSQHDGYDVFLKSTNKATAVEPMLKRLGLTWDNVIAFGDAGNDTPFISKAAIGVALGNSKDGVKSSADIVADDCDNDGVAKILEQLFLDK